MTSCRALRIWLRAMALSLGLTLISAGASAQVLRIDRMSELSANDSTPPADSRAWKSVALPHHQTDASSPEISVATWYRGSFNLSLDESANADWAIYFPYFYDGGQVWLNGNFVGDVPESTEQVRVRWERPHLIAFPASLLRTGANDLLIRASAPRESSARHFPQVLVGPRAQLMHVYDRRFFWVRTMPQITVVVCLLVSALVLFIWWQRRSEVLYGLFGLAAALWGIRTLTFVIDAVPTQWWLPWRVIYLVGTGGFIVVMALFTLHFAGIRRIWLQRALLLYWAVGPLSLLVEGATGETVVNRVWSAGLIPIGMSILALSVWTMRHQKTFQAAVLPVALVVAVLAGVHDYFVAFAAGAIAPLLPGWADQRIFLLHHGANILLLTMGGMLAARFIQALNSVEELNQNLESRVADRERHLEANYARLATLKEQAAVAQEREVIMRELHDGLGSRLFVTLSRVERRDMDYGEIAAALRDCVSEMRLAIDAVAPDDNDFRTVLGNFLFRWQVPLEEAKVRPRWSIEVPDRELPLPPHASLQLLRIAQEALTNVLKHSKATHVQVGLRQIDGRLELRIIDDGHCWRQTSGAGRGLVNMHARAKQLGGDLQVHSDGAGTRVVLRFPVDQTAARQQELPSGSTAANAGPMIANAGLPA